MTKTLKYPHLHSLVEGLNVPKKVEITLDSSQHEKYYKLKEKYDLTWRGVLEKGIEKIEEELEAKE